jgi:RsiW-degrading membrane proteinase PrsW (M82 family)
MTISTALGFGALAAFLYSLRDIANDVTFVFSAGTAVAFALGATAGWAFWRGVRYVMQRKRENIP